MDVYVERGSKRVFVSAVDWPGWARGGRDEASALESMLASAPRYAKIVAGSRLDFRAPASVSEFRVVERVKGNATTDFGAPDVEAKADAAALNATELARLETLIRSAWRAFDDAVREAKGKTLAKGPRGGGRSLAKIVDHVREAEWGYLSGLGWRGGEKDVREAVIAGLRASARGEIPAKGPRGGARWKPRKFVRRLAWHSVDHAWEIEDRAVS